MAEEATMNVLLAAGQAKRVLKGMAEVGFNRSETGSFQGEIDRVFVQLRTVFATADKTLYEKPIIKEGKQVVDGDGKPLMEMVPGATTQRLFGGNGEEATLITCPQQGENQGWERLVCNKGDETVVMVREEGGLVTDWTDARSEDQAFRSNDSLALSSIQEHMIKAIGVVAATK